VNQAGRTVVVVPLSTKIEKANSYRILLPASEITRDLSSQSTIENSVALCDHIREIDKSRLQSKMGKLSQNAVFAVQLGLANIFDIR
jgi:mRNA-degrading endonuclease toxin of MazEF toxin-antitoxin module